MNVIGLVVLHMIVLHTVDGHEVAINPKQITSMHAKASAQNKLLTDNVACVIGLTDGKFISVAETCDIVKQRLEAAK